MNTVSKTIQKSGWNIGYEGVCIESISSFASCIVKIDDSHVGKMY